MKRFWPRVRYYLVSVALGAVTVPLAFVYYLLGFFSPRSVYRLAQVWTQVWCDLFGARIFVFGLNRPQWENASVLVANHLSYLDIPAVLLTAPIQIHFIATRGVSRVPVIGSAMRRIRMTFIDRSTGDGGYKAIDQAAGNIAGGRHVLSYPEGRISRDGRMGPFKKGLFRLALRARVPIVPVVIRGSHRVMDCIGKTSRPGIVEVEFCESIDTTGYSEEDLDSLMTRVRNVMLENYADGSLKGGGVELFKHPKDG